MPHDLDIFLDIKSCFQEDVYFGCRRCMSGLSIIKQVHLKKVSAAYLDLYNIDEMAMIRNRYNRIPQMRLK